jgi:poly(3-hydroxyalkanoate) synthetase
MASRDVPRNRPERVPAREIGAGLLKPIEDAPGSYVRVKG